MSAPAPLRTAIIGVSGFGDVHYQDLLREADAGRLQPVAATIINPDDEAEKCACLRNHGAALFVDYQEMLRQHAGGLDLCLIPTGIALHAPMSRAALAAGAHVYVEKPIAATVEDADAMAAAAEAAGRVLAVGYQNMYDPGLHVLKERIVAGAIGAVESVACWGCWPRPDSYYARNGWAGRLRVGEAWVLDAPFNNAFAHYVMLSLFLAGAEARTRARPTAVEAELYRARPAIESPDTAAIRVATAEGATVFLALTLCSAENAGPEITVRGSRGTARWTAGGAVVAPADGPEERIELLQHTALRSAIFENLTARIHGEDAFVCTADLARGQTLVADAAFDATPIRTIPESAVTRQERENGAFSVIDGIDEAARRAAADSRTFAELGLPWATAGGRLPLDAYTAFRGGAEG